MFRNCGLLEQDAPCKIRSVNKTDNNGNINIAKGTTDPRVEFSNSGNLNKSSSWHLHTPESHQSSLLNGSQSFSQSVSQLVTRIANDRTRVR